MSAFSRHVLGLSDRFRKRRMDRFLSMLGVKPGDRILDVGGLPGTWRGTGHEQWVTLLNLTPPPDTSGPFAWRTGNACDMHDIGDGSFDIVFSNSVIEHVGDWPEQLRMAQEIRRVGRKYWVQTPNRSFPLEVHFLFPFFQYLPTAARHAVARTWPFSFAKIYNLDPIAEADHIWLIDEARMAKLFPDAKVLRERTLGMTKSLVAFRT